MSCPNIEPGVIAAADQRMAEVAKFLTYAAREFRRQFPDPDSIAVCRLSITLEKCLSRYGLSDALALAISHIGERK